MNSAFPRLLMAALLAATATATAGQFNVECSYSHTLPDDPIMFPGKPGRSMVHDFFGNTSSDAFTTNADLLALPDNTCDNAADSSAYWAPQLRRAGGTQIVRPTLQKTYYRAVNVLNHPVTPFPAGLPADRRQPDGDRTNPADDQLLLRPRGLFEHEAHCVSG